MLRPHRPACCMLGSGLGRSRPEGPHNEMITHRGVWRAQAAAAAAGGQRSKRTRSLEACHFVPPRSLPSVLWTRAQSAASRLAPRALVQCRHRCGVWRRAAAVESLRAQERWQLRGKIAAVACYSCRRCCALRQRRSRRAALACVAARAPSLSQVCPQCRLALRAVAGSVATRRLRPNRSPDPQ